MLTAGTRLSGHYEILGQLGAGGMGVVYRALDLRLRREVAIKVLPGKTARDTESLLRFQREAEVLASLSHPNILAIFDFEAEGDLASDSWLDINAAPSASFSR